VIPVMIVPILTQPDLLLRMLRSIDHPVGMVIVIDNGGVVETHVGWDHQIPVPVRVVKPGWNLGVAASWNLGIKCSPLAAWWAIVNHDVAFGPGDLARLDAAVGPRANAVYYSLGMAAFAVTPPAMQAVGWWDENIHPAYDEDLDWQRRARLVGTLEVETGFTGLHEGSATIMSDRALRAANGRTHPANDAYYAVKWGGPKQGGERHSTPFNRGGSVADWTLDINRLREYTWPRKEE
jgi:GT2 family glycosyltransferase